MENEKTLERIADSLEKLNDKLSFFDEEYITGSYKKEIQTLSSRVDELSNALLRHSDY